MAKNRKNLVDEGKLRRVVIALSEEIKLYNLPKRESDDLLVTVADEMAFRLSYFARNWVGEFND